jgi:hypothetical protein
MNASSLGLPGLKGFFASPEGVGGGGNIFPSIDRTCLCNRDEEELPLRGDEPVIPLEEVILAARSFSVIRSATVPERFRAAVLGEGEVMLPSVDDMEGDLIDAVEGANRALLSALILDLDLLVFTIISQASFGSISSFQLSNQLIFPFPLPTSTPLRERTYSIQFPNLFFPNPNSPILTQNLLPTLNNPIMMPFSPLLKPYQNPILQLYR